MLSGVGGGTYGTVFRVVNLSDNSNFVVKRMSISKGVGVLTATSVREISTLSLLSSDVAVSYFDFFIRRRFLYLVFELMSADLKKIFNSFPRLCSHLSVLRRF